MKLKNIFITALAAGLLTACVTEDIDNATPSNVIAGIDTSLGLTISVGGTQTKAGEYLGEVGNEYELANPEELVVTSAAVAIFETSNGQPTSLIGYKYFSAPPVADPGVGPINTSGEGARTDSLAYKLEKIPAKTGVVRIVVIANSTTINSETELAKLTNYAELQKKIETNKQEGAISPLFTPEKLVKVGEINYPLSTTNNANIVVPMTQLAARILLSFKVDALPDVNGVPYYKNWKYSPEDVEGWSKSKIPAGVDASECSIHDDFPYNGFIVRKKNSGSKVIEVRGNTAQYVRPFIAWSYKVSSLSISNIETQSKIILGANPESQNLLKLTPNAGDLSGVFTFYTYEKYDTESPNPITIEVNGEVRRTTVDSITNVSGTFHGLWLKKVSKTDETLAPPENGIYIADPGFGDLGKYILIPELNVVKIIGEPEIGDKAIESRPANFTATIIPRIDQKGCNTNGVIHGNSYEVIGKIPLTHQKVNFEYNVTPWIFDLRETEVNYTPVFFLQVTDLEMVMPNVKVATTSFQSSSAVSINGITAQYYNLATNTYTDVKDNIADIIQIYPTSGNNGTITIDSKIPDNFMPRKITFIVKNVQGLTQEVTVMQYPPLFVNVLKSDDSKDSGNDQINRNIYNIKSLIANYSTLPAPDEFDEDTNIFNIKHDHKILNNSITNDNPNIKTQGLAKGTYLQTKAITGYPLLDGDGCTLNSEENNRRISPNFMLASQYGTTVPHNEYRYPRYDNRTYQSEGKTVTDKSCRNYTESQGGKTYDDWRLPTLAELHLIDVLQNIKKCDVKAILEGRSYWSAQSSGPILFMDPRVNTGNKDDGSWRCVRDVK